MAYFRVTAYHPAEDVSAIIDSNGYFEKLWQLSSCLVQKGFKIAEASSSFQDGTLPKADAAPPAPDSPGLPHRQAGIPKRRRPGGRKMLSSKEMT